MSTSKKYTSTDYRSYLDASSPVLECWDDKLSEVVDVDPFELIDDLGRPEVKERLRIFSFLLIGLVSRFWNGNKFLDNNTTQNDHTFKENRGGGTYPGHNVACLAVGRDSRIITYEFHHHDFAGSLVEHAEARIIRRLFDLRVPLYDWRSGREINQAERRRQLQDVTVITSLQSCPQCTGAMMWGRVAKLVYLQTDPGVAALSNLMCKLAGTNKEGSNLAPVPVHGACIDFPYSHSLDEGYARFMSNSPSSSESHDFELAHRPSNSFARDRSITSYLCTPYAQSQFSRGGKEFDTLQLQFPTYRCSLSEHSASNEECLSEARMFFEYVSSRGKRRPPVSISSTIGT